MDCSKQWEQNSLATEIIQGMELAKQLRLSQNATASSSDTRQFLVQRILSSYEKALSILSWNNNASPTAIATVPESLTSANAAPSSDDYNKIPKDHQDLTDVSKKRKVMAKWTDHVLRFSSDNGMEGPHEDGHSWRKYGQKEILGAKYRRSYYRCTYRNTQSCYATKQVQRSDEDPNIFEITYKGKHTCCHGSISVPPPPSPEKQERKRHDHNSDSQQQQLQGNQMSFPNNLRVNTENSEGRENMTSPFSFTSASFGCMVSDDAFLSSMLEGDTFFDNFNPSLLSLPRGESNYYLLPPGQMRNIAGNKQRSESDLTEIISGNNSSTNSPIPDMDFSLEPEETNFQFDAPGFF